MILLECFESSVFPAFRISVDESSKDLISKNLKYLKRMAGWRIFITFKHILREPNPHKILYEAHATGILPNNHSSLD
ncbi:MAG: hypothetical protein CM1200mP38_6670 [Dehalococcoidia bacterium]|nr:MAG: hypothetical protein CM1200mP38_6670 [Dehalococcoidia bacterium]